MMIPFPADSTTDIDLTRLDNVNPKLGPDFIGPDPHLDSAADPVQALADLLTAATPYQTTLLTYVALALRPHLSPNEAQHLDDILAQATQDIRLSVWLDELDHWLAQQIPLLSPAAVQQQQAELQRSIATTGTADLPAESHWSSCARSPQTVHAKF